MARAPNKPKNSAALNPSTPSLAYRAQAPRWALIDACLGGTETMRAAGQALLPKHEGESSKHYTERANTAVFTNFTRLTLDFLTGKPYSEKVKFRDGTPQSLLNLETDIDLQGNDITTVTKDFFWKGLGKGHSYLMVEYPVQDQEEITLEEANTNGLRPYWVVISPEYILADRQIRIEGKQTFSHVRVWSTETEPDGFDEKVVNRITQYDLMKVTDPQNPKAKPTYAVQVIVYRQKNKTEWPVEKPARLLRGIDRITLVKFQTNAEERPELLDLAYLNVSHYQSYSDQRSCLTMARFPILAGSGVDKEEGRIIGPYELLTTSDPTAKFYYVENQGTALGVGDKDVISLEDKMAMYGAELLKKRPGRETATSRILDATESMAPLQIIVLQFMSALEQACDYTLRWLQDAAADDANTYGIDVNIDFAMSEEQQKQMQFMENSRLQGDVSRKQFFKAAKELGYMPESFNPTENDSELAVERQDYLKQLEAVAAAKPDPTITGAGGQINDATPVKITKSATISDRTKTNG